MAKKGKCSVVFEKITPKKAAKYLEFNTGNRRVSQNNLNKIISDMKEGRWMMNGDTISFLESGKLSDGQHRLLACVKSNVTFDALVARGLPEDSMSTKDIGKPRSIANVLTIRGIENSQIKTAAAKVIRVLEPVLENHVTDIKSLNYKGSSTVIMDFVIENDDLLDLSVRAVSRNNAVHMRQKSVHAAMYFILHGISPDLAAEFYTHLITGANLGIDDPIYKLKEALNRRSMIVRTKKTDNEVSEKLWIVAVTIKAWNYWLSGSTVKKFGWGAKSKFPTLKESM